MNEIKRDICEEIIAKFGVDGATALAAILKKECVTGRMLKYALAEKWIREEWDGVMSSREVAAKLGVSHDYVCDILNSKACK